MFNAITHSGIWVTDQDEAVDFYVGKLGLEVHTDVQADLRHRPLGLAQQRHRALQPAPLQVAVRRLSERLLERADEVRLGGQRDPRQSRDVERLVVGTVHLVASPQHAAAGGVDPDHARDLSARSTAARACDVGALLAAVRAEALDGPPLTVGVVGAARARHRAEPLGTVGRA